MPEAESDRSAPAQKDDPQLRARNIERVMSLIGIIDQLFVARATKALRPTGLPFARFTILNHFSHDPARGWTISALAKVMDLNQPGTTKLVQKLEAQGYLIAMPDPKDQRIKRMFITAEGAKAYRTAIELLAPDIAKAFGQIDGPALQALRAPLEQLKSWFDDNRG